MDSHTFPIDAPEDGKLKDDAGDVDGRKSLNSWKRSHRIIRICKIFNWGLGKSHSPQVSDIAQGAEEVKPKKGKT